MCLHYFTLFYIILHYLVDLIMGLLNFDYVCIILGENNDNNVYIMGFHNNVFSFGRSP